MSWTTIKMPGKSDLQSNPNSLHNGDSYLLEVHIHV